MRSLFQPRASAAFAFAFGSCMEGWYYRCLGLDPWISHTRIPSCSLEIFFFCFFSCSPTPPSSPFQPHSKLSTFQPRFLKIFFRVLLFVFILFLPFVFATMVLYKPKKNQNAKGNRLLISVTVMRSAGPIRFVVGERELVASVIDTALKSYAREGRLPVLGSNLDDFFLYCPNAGLDGKEIRNPPQFCLQCSRIFNYFSIFCSFPFRFSVQLCPILKTYLGLDKFYLCSSWLVLSQNLCCLNSRPASFNCGNFMLCWLIGKRNWVGQLYEFWKI